MAVKSPHERRDQGAADDDKQNGQCRNDTEAPESASDGTSEFYGRPTGRDVDIRIVSGPRCGDETPGFAWG